MCGNVRRGNDMSGTRICGRDTSGIDMRGGRHDVIVFRTDKYARTIPECCQETEVCLLFLPYRFSRDRAGRRDIDENFSRVHVCTAATVSDNIGRVNCMIAGTTCMRKEAMIRTPSPIATKKRIHKRTSCAMRGNDGFGDGDCLRGVLTPFLYHSL